MSTLNTPSGPPGMTRSRGSPKGPQGDRGRLPRGRRLAGSGGEPDAGFEFAGLLAFEDPVREGVREAVRDCMPPGSTLSWSPAIIRRRPSRSRRASALAERPPV